MPLQIRRGLEAERSTLTSLTGLVVGELLYTTDSQKLYIGTGVTGQHQGVAITGYTNEDAQDAVGPLLQNGNHVGISFVYDDATPSIDATVDLSNYSGVIRADSFNGSFVADNSTVLIDGTEGSFNLDGTVKGSIVPSSDSMYDLGSSLHKFKDLYLSGSSIHLGSALITASGSGINLPAGSTIDGEPLNSPMTFTELSVNVIADDSTVMVNTTTRAIVAAGGFTGDLLGDVTGNVTGDLTGNVTGDISGIVTGTAGSSIIGTVQGNVLADNTDVIIDAVTKTVYALAVDTGNALYDDNGITSSSSGTFSIGSTADLLKLALNLDGNLQLRQIYDPSGGSGYITTTQSRGTASAPAAVQAGDELGGLLFKAYTDASTSAVAGLISFVVDSTAVIAGGNYVKTQIILNAASDSTQDPAKSLILDSAGVVSAPTFRAGDGTAGNPSIGFTTDGSTDTGLYHPGDGILCISTDAQERVRVDSGGMRVVGFMKVGSFATGSLPSPAETGMIAFDSSTNQFKGYNGSGWVVLG